MLKEQDEALAEFPESSGPPAGESASSEEALERLVAERDRAVLEHSELLERFQRAQAEFENIRKRLTREQEETREYAAMATVEALLPVIDDFERALSVEGLEPEIAKGFELIHKRLFDVCARAGLQTIEECGTFDPQRHQAVDRAPAEADEDDQRIVAVYRKGYLFKDRLLRPAMVKVAVRE